MKQEELKQLLIIFVHRYYNIPEVDANISAKHFLHHNTILFPIKEEPKQDPIEDIGQPEMWQDARKIFFSKFSDPIELLTQLFTIKRKQ